MAILSYYTSFNTQLINKYKNYFKKLNLNIDLINRIKSIRYDKILDIYINNVMFNNFIISYYYDYDKVHNIYIEKNKLNLFKKNYRRKQDYVIFDKFTNMKDFNLFTKVDIL